MRKRRFTEKFKEEAVSQIKERIYSVREVSRRIGVSTYTTYRLYKWPKQVRGNQVLIYHGSSGRISGEFDVQGNEGAQERGTPTGI